MGCAASKKENGVVAYALEPPHRHFPGNTTLPAPNALTVVAPTARLDEVEAELSASAAWDDSSAPEVEAIAVVEQAHERLLPRTRRSFTNEGMLMQLDADDLYKLIAQQLASAPSNCAALARTCHTCGSRAHDGDALVWKRGGLGSLPLHPVS